MNHSLRIALISLASASVLLSCQNPFSKQGSSTGTLCVSITASQKVSRSILPSSSYVSYSITGTGPSGASIPATSSSTGSFSYTNLAPGEWTISVQALGSGAVVVAAGSATTSVSVGSVASTSIQLLPASGTGSLSLSATWPSSLGITAVTGTLTPDGGSAQAISFTVSGTSARYAKADIAAGSYLLVVNFTKSGSAVGAPLTEAVLVYNGAATTGVLVPINTTKLSLAGRVSTLAGRDHCSDGTGSSAGFFDPDGVACDGTNLYIADAMNNTIRKVALASGTVSTLAGSAGIAGSADGTGAAARFNEPRGVAIIGSYLYIVDHKNGTIRKAETTTGEVTTLAGKLYHSGCIDGTGIGAAFNSPYGIASDGTNLYVTEYSAIRKIEASTGIVTTVAGSASNKTGSTDGTGSAARFNSPYGIAYYDSNLYIADTFNYTIRKIDVSSGSVTTIAGSAGSNGNTNGIGTAARFFSPRGLASDGTNLYVGDCSNEVIRTINLSTCEVMTLAGGGTGSTDGTGTAAGIAAPHGIALFGASLYVTEGSNVVRKIILATTVVSTIAGQVWSGSTDGTGVNARFKAPTELVAVGDYLYATDYDNHTIRRISITTGAVTTFAGSAATSGSSDGTGTSALFTFPYGITSDGTNLYVTDWFAIRKIVISSAEVTTIAGSKTISGNSDGTGTSARFRTLHGLTCDGTTLYINDYGNNTIRKMIIDTTVVSTLAGSGSAGSSDGTGTAAAFSYLNGIATDGTYLYVTETNNGIRKIEIASGVVTKLAFSESLYVNEGIICDGTYLYTTSNYNLIKVDIDNVSWTTLAGAVGSQGSIDGTGSTARFYLPVGIATDGLNLYVADCNNSNIRMIQ
jgi:hypothetical protein